MATNDSSEPDDWARTLKGASDEYVRSPLWHFPPSARPAVLHERAIRFGEPSEDDFDPEYH